MLERCEHGCNKGFDGKGPTKRSKRYDICMHKAQKYKLPLDNHGKNYRNETAVSSSSLEDNPDLKDGITQESLEVLATTLLGFGLQDYEVDVVIAHDVLGYTLEEVTALAGYTNISATKRVYDLGVEKAKNGYAAFEMRKS